MSHRPMTGNLSDMQPYYYRDSHVDTRPITDVTSNDVICNGGQVPKGRYPVYYIDFAYSPNPLRKPLPKEIINVRTPVSESRHKTLC